MRLNGKVAAITGGASGIGRATVRRLAIEGAAVVIADVNRAAGETLASELRADGREAMYVQTDVSDETSVADLVDTAVSTYGQLDVMYNNAGISRHHVTDETGWWRLVGINLTGVFLGCKHAVRVMRPKRRGSIISTASVAGTRGSTNNIYGASKAGVIALTAHVALACLDDGIRVNAVSPGIVDTSFFDPRREDTLRRYWQGDASAYQSDPVLTGEDHPGMAEFQQHMAGWRQSGRCAKPDDIARSVSFLASDESSFVIGHNLMTTGLTQSPNLVRRIAASRRDMLPVERIDNLSGRVVVLATAHEPLSQFLAKHFEGEGARVVTLDPGRFLDPALVRADLEAAAGTGPIALVLFAMRPDRGGDLLSTTVEGWTDELKANLRAPTVVVEAAIEQVAAGGAIVIVSDTAGTWGGPASPAYCASAGALTYHTEFWANQALARRVRVHALIAEDLSQIQTEPRLGGPVSGSELGELATYLTTDLPGLAGLQLSLQAAHPGAPPLR